MITDGARARFSSVAGQAGAVAQLEAAIAAPVHAYLFVGPPGTGKRAAAQAFAAALLCPAGGGDGCETCRRVLAGGHPDVRVVERTGAAITVDEAREISRLANRTPVEGTRKVLVLADFHLVEQAAPALLKTIEEPAASTVFVVLADQLPRELQTIASRCVRITFGPVPVEAIIDVLVTDGVDADLAAEVAAAAGGNLDRARLLASDPAFAGRLATWKAIPTDLDGTGAAVAAAVDAIVAGLETAVAPVRARQEAELAAMAERQQQYGDPGANKRDVEARHRREQRRVRTDELRAGMAVLAGYYRDRLVAGGAGAAGVADRVKAIAEAAQVLERNPNESLLLQALLLRLSRS